MKKILIICLFLIVFLVGCGEPTPPEVVIDYEKVGEITDSIDILYSEIENIKFSDEETQNEIIRIRNLYDELKQEEKDLITNFSDFEEIENMYKQYIEQKEKEEAEKQKIIDAVAEAVALCDTTVPKTSTGENIELPNSYTSEDGVSVYIGWTTSDPLTITNKGMVTQPRKSVVAVTLTAVCRSGDVSEKFTRRVSVGPLGYTTLPEKPVFAYYFTNLRALTEQERKTINVINLSFGNIASDGTVSVGGLNSETILQERKYGIRVCFSVQNKEGFKTWTATPDKREKLAQSFLDTCEKYHFDGVDIDWEYPEGAAEVANYVDFMKILYNKFKKANSNYLVTSAMYGGNGVPKYNAGESYKYMDYIHLMTYDLNAPDLSTHLTGLSSGYASSTSVESTIASYTGAGIPKEKLVIGGAFYGKVYELDPNSNGFIRQKPISDPYTIVYSQIYVNYLSKLNNNDGKIKVVREWDKDANAPYLCITEYDDNGKITGKKFITYDDPESLTLKSQYVFEQGLGGLMFWELGYEYRESNPLVKAIYDVFYK